MKESACEEQCESCVLIALLETGRELKMLCVVRLRS